MSEPGAEVNHFKWLSQEGGRGWKKDNNADSTCCEMLVLWMTELGW